MVGQADSKGRVQALAIPISSRRAYMDESRCGSCGLAVEVMLGRKRGKRKAVGRPVANAASASWKPVIYQANRSSPWSLIIHTHNANCEGRDGLYLIGYCLTRKGLPHKVSPQTVFRVRFCGTTCQPSSHCPTKDDNHVQFRRRNASTHGVRGGTSLRAACWSRIQARKCHHET